MARRVKFSDKVRQYDCTIFKALAVGQKFRFGSEVEYLGMKRGLCEKLSARKYKYVEDGMECEVGSIHAVVLKVDAEGEPIRVGHYVPYLGD